MPNLASRKRRRRMIWRWRIRCWRRKRKKRYGRTSRLSPGVMTPTEAVAALSAGADIIKVFPGDIVGTKMIKDIHGPLPQAALMPSGGVSVENTAEWFHAGAVAVSAGGSLTGSAKTGDYDGVTAKAKEFVRAVAAARA